MRRTRSIGFIMGQGRREPSWLPAAPAPVDIAMCKSRQEQNGEVVGPMILTQGDLELLKQLKAAGERGRNVRELSTRVTLDRLVKGGYLVARPTDPGLVQYRITQRGQDAIVEHDL
jgi:hypothetical protein